MTEVKTIFLSALEIGDAEQRAAYLAEACGGNAEMRRQVDLLLKAHERAGGFLKPIAFDPSAGPDQSPVTEGPGTVIGRYKLLERIGEGGMAVVYMAESATGGPIRRKVALKIIKLGMDTRQVIARFEAERQVLALMDHPSIAKVHDAGATETGRPYFVMELVQGVSITEYCDRNSLSTKDRLTLFIQVCNAMQHAHQKGIIHRDIKPSNVMVTHHDGKPVPKIIDFGIAKATNQRLTEKTLFTRYAHIVGTPAYMSPEQAELSDLDVDTRSDIYSLGVLLYELLTGTTPFSEEELRKAGYIEMQRVIREQEPVKPSTKLTTLGETLTDVAKRRGCTPDLLRKAVRGDLDWIVMKSLEKDRAQRYETPNGLAGDIRRHLGHEPVQARGPSTTYRLQKFLRRHRVQALVGLVFGVLIAVVAVVLSMWNRDRVQLVEAEGFKDKGILSLAREQYAKAEREASLETLRPLLTSEHVGPEAQLLQSIILVDNRHPDEAATILNSLLNERPEVAGAAQSLLARILWESESPDTQKLKEIEEHRRRAEALLPETAEAYFLRAMTAMTVKEQLAALDKALQLDPGHYESRRLRAFTYYASRKYERLNDDALVMTVLRPRDPLGYELRAVSWRELERYPEAITDYDIAIGLTPKTDPQYVDLSAQRREVLLRMGDYARVVAETQAAKKDVPLLQYHLFGALTAMGDYDKATTLFREIIARGHEARGQFRDWCAKYVFDTLEAGRSWHPTDREPAGAAFLPMIEAEETYRGLSAKAHRLTTDGFSAAWSPDGKKVAFSLGVHGYSGVAVYDPATKETDLLIVPGKDPRWSLDGKSIAFVRDCELLRLEELAMTERENRHRPVTDEEVWLMKSDGTEPRRLAQGSWPTWGSDSQHLYYLSRKDGALCSFSLVGQDAKPKQILKCSALSSVSPDNRHVSYFEGGSLKIVDLTSQKPVAECHMPSITWGVTGWSPKGNEVCLGGSNPQEEKTGLWVYDLQEGKFLRVLDGQITAPCRSPAGTELAFCLGPPYFEIWAADLDPSVPTVEALGARRTLNDHFQEMVAFYTRRIKADPQDAYAYSSRAHHYDCLHDRAKANADMMRFSKIFGGGLPLDSQFGTWRNRRHVVHLPFDCQLVFSAERPVNEIPVVSVAFGQKGRYEMRLCEIPMFIVSLLGSGVLTDLDTSVVHADFTFGEPVRIESVIPVLGGAFRQVQCLSYDGLEMYLMSDQTVGAYGDLDLWMCKRKSKDEDWAPPVNLGATVNSASEDSWPSISADGLTLYFTSNRPGGVGNYDIYAATRASTDDSWGQAVNLGPRINSPMTDGEPWISPDGLELYFESYRGGGYGRADIYVAKRPTVDDPWGDPANLGPVVNSPYGEQYLSLSPDGLLLFFSDRDAPYRPGGYGTLDMWMTRRESLSKPWQTPVNLGAQVNGLSWDWQPRISPEGDTFYFAADRAGVWDCWLASIVPIVDFNADDKVDAEDMAMLADNWGLNEPLCDIAPFAWGDGIVDEKDLKVLMESVMTPAQHAADVSRDVILSWISPSFAESHDVYFGTSLDDVSNATRDDPCGVLVSMGQAETTYDPDGPLEFSRTYYWRIDTVLGPANTAICKGPVLSFTTEAYAYPIQNITAAASSKQSGMGPERTVDSSGLDASDGHSTNGTDMWQSTNVGPHWIEFEFDKVYVLHELWVWNSNQLIEPFLGFGARTVKIVYSADGTTWASLEGVPEFAQAPGMPGYTADTIVNFAGVSAKYVRLTIEKGWGVTPSVGLSEVRFFYIPIASATKP